jgi:hypothetical protein
MIEKTDLKGKAAPLRLEKIFGRVQSDAAPSYRVAEAPLGQEVQREVQRVHFPLFGPLLFGHSTLESAPFSPLF